MLTPCKQCRRYIRVESTPANSCPFCSRGETSPPGGSIRAGTVAMGTVAVMAAAALTACQSGQPDPAGASDVNPPATAAVPSIEDTPATGDDANNTATLPEPTAATSSSAAPADSVADNKPPPAPATVAPPATMPRPVVMRYGISPRLPRPAPTSPNKK